MPPSPARPRPRPAPHGPPPAAARSSTSGSGGILAALCLLLVAYTNPSLLGLAFLLAFLAWGSLCLPTPTTTAAAQRLWAAVSGEWLAVQQAGVRAGAAAVVHTLLSC